MKKRTFQFYIPLYRGKIGVNRINRTNRTNRAMGQWGNGGGIAALAAKDAECRVARSHQGAPLRCHSVCWREQ